MISLFEISQIGIGVFGATSFLCVTRSDVIWQKRGTILGLISGPFWYATVYFTDQWITLPIHMLYTFGWLLKVKELWFTKKEKK